MALWKYLGCACVLLATPVFGEVGHELADPAVDDLAGVQPRRLRAGTPRRLKSSGDGSPWLIGVVLWLTIPCCLWNNERIAIKQQKIQYKAGRYAIHVDDIERKPLEEMEGRIVYVAGEAQCNEVLQDDAFPSVKSKGKIKLRRIVEMYQWVEEEHSKDGKTWYTHHKAWKDTQQECPHGGQAHCNPRMPIPSTRRQATYQAYYDALAGNGHPCKEAKHENVKLGTYYLGEYVIRELLRWKKKTVTAEMLRDRRSLSGGSLPQVSNNYNSNFPSQKNGGVAPLDGEAVEQDGKWYFGNRFDEIGAVRVYFEELDAGPMSIVAVLCQTGKGWTFVPVRRADEGGIGENIALEICGGCCCRVKELHYGDESDDEEFLEQLEDREEELTAKQKKGFRSAKTTKGLKEYETEEDFSDLCCAGPFAGCLMSLMHWLGLEEEFLAVREKDIPLRQVMATEGKLAASRHHIARVAGLILLVLGGEMIIDPIVKLLNYNWAVSLMGGGLLSAALALVSCLCSLGSYSVIVSVAWIAYRPAMAILGITLAVCSYATIAWYLHSHAVTHELTTAAPTATVAAAVTTTQAAVQAVVVAAQPAVAVVQQTGRRLFAQML